MLEPDITPGQKRAGWVLFAVALIAALVLLAIVLTDIDRRPRTNDASVGAEVIHVTAGVPGRIARLDVAENDAVEEGAPLFALDDTAYRLQRDQAAAQVAAAQAALADAERAARATAQNAGSAADEVARAEQNLALAEATVARLEPLAADGIASRQTLDEARTAAADARVSLDVARKTAGAARDLVSNTDALAAELRAAEAVLAVAEHRLSQTEVAAPFSGYVSGLQAGVGSWVLPEQPVLVLIDDASWHVEAYFRETELAAIAPGMVAHVRVLSDAGEVLTGRVASIGRGVQTSDALAVQGLLPFVPRSTDWVRLARRYPVRIALDAPLPPFLRLGASASVTIGQGE
ncbi:HlyD family efflux transporter periplasmic adaptor subunit [Oceanomicrobium pacificus]|uniref:HlyD family efflux transporter periplasmic adaptor subunit n=1 Tax=Oceanomicrobium pacificus TaxID=2692916 RepID=A0A6B0TTE7_9RHOB|nr:HlyD family efflux transporter periplasmic adaptor subunit [Oceanomicrobium pacificus]MXU66049.1 HlyD family efflux transporter periplasmic adaptor subunit [Oceanomicrobium pacificus]